LISEPLFSQPFRRPPRHAHKLRRTNDVSFNYYHRQPAAAHPPTTVDHADDDGGGGILQAFKNKSVTRRMCKHINLCASSGVLLIVAGANNIIFLHDHTASAIDYIYGYLHSVKLYTYTRGTCAHNSYVSVCDYAWPTNIKYAGPVIIIISNQILLYLYSIFIKRASTYQLSLDCDLFIYLFFHNSYIISKNYLIKWN